MLVEKKAPYEARVDGKREGKKDRGAGTMVRMSKKKISIPLGG